MLTDSQGKKYLIHIKRLTRGNYQVSRNKYFFYIMSKLIALGKKCLTYIYYSSGELRFRTKLLY